MLAAVGFRSLPLNRAVICSGLVGFLLLPTNVAIELAGLPDLSKSSAVCIGIIATYFNHRRSGPVGALPRTSVVLIAVLVVSNVVTALTNGDPFYKPDASLPGLTMHDAFGMTFQNVLTISTVVIGARVLSEQKDHREMLLLFGAAMLAYSLPTLLEIRLSPQLHNWIYGFYPADFGQQMRGGGFRSSVFLSHGLVLAWFLAVGTASLMALRRSDARVLGVRPQILSAYLWVVLVLQKSLGGLLLGSVMNLVLFVRPSKQVALAAVVAVIFLAYPIARGSGLVPVARINSTVAEFSSERSGSFQTRLVNEDQLLAKAGQRPWFGWGGWGRSRVFDPETGRDVSITDGYWIIVLGYSGWIGYLSHFGLMCLPLLGLYRHRRQVPAETAALALILSGNLVDMIPNASATPITWMMVGALTGALAAARRDTRVAGKRQGGNLPAGLKPAFEAADVR